MSTSTGPKKNRKDFGFAATVASSVGLPNEETTPVIEEPIINEEKPIEKPLIIEKEPEIDNREVIISDFQENTTQDTPQDNTQDDIPEPVEMPEVDPIPEIEFKRNSQNSSDDIDKILSLSRNTHGVQKSIYLDEDIYLYIQDKCEKNKAKFSTVINLLLRKYINSQK